MGRQLCVYNKIFHCFPIPKIDLIAIRKKEQRKKKIKKKYSEWKCPNNIIKPTAETWIYEAFVLMGGTRVVLIFIAFLEAMECVEKLGRMKSGLVSTFPFLHAKNAEKHHLSSPITTQAS